MTNRTLVVDVEPPNNSEPQIRQLPTPTTPRDARIIALVLASMGVQSSFKGVVRANSPSANVTNSNSAPHSAQTGARHVTQSPEQLRDSNRAQRPMQVLTPIKLLASIALQLCRPAYPTLPWEPEWHFISRSISTSNPPDAFQGQKKFQQMLFWSTFFPKTL
ncbi:hypothetical protein BY996DRAFT_6615324 [Phakopsora pachyrhizi]|nr:hypothetical protein BY996DRAFT_6615324 [Phakopsora pachyrhizi]